MKHIIITRKKQFVNALMPFWIITGQPKAEFMEKHGLMSDRVKADLMGQPIQQLHDLSVLDTAGTRILNGQTVTLEVPNEVCTVFAATMAGALSNEVQLGCGGDAPIRLTLSAKGGLFVPVYPWLVIHEAEQEDIR